MIDLAWLVVAGVLLLVAGLAAVAYDSVRRRQGTNPFPYPDTTTRLLEAPAALPAPASTPRPARALPIPRGPWHSGARAALLAKRLLGLRRRRAVAVRPRRLVGAFLAVGFIITLGTGAYIAATGTPMKRPGAIVVAICRFESAAREGSPHDFLGTELLRAAAATGFADLAVRPSDRTCSSTEEAAGQLRRLGADFLFWGKVERSGAITAQVQIAPDFTVRQEPWQMWSARDASLLVLPATNEINLPAATGVYPFVPLGISLGALHRGDFRSASRSAYGAAASLEGSGGSAPLASLLNAVALAYAADYPGASQVLTELETRTPLEPEAHIARAYSRLQLSDNGGALSDADAVLADRTASDKTRARAHLLRARANFRLAGADDSALTDLDEGLRLDPSYLPARLDRAEVLYRLSQPDAARTELETVLKYAPDAAAAHRLLGLVWLMLDKEEEAQRSFTSAQAIYVRWIAGLRADEAKAQGEGDRAGAQSATEGIILLNREMASVYLYQGMALADKARQEPPESFLGGLWRRVRGQPTTFERAMSALQEAARSDPRRTEILLQIGTVYADSGDPGAAAETFREAQAINPTVEEPYLALARLQVKQGNPGEAVQTLEEILDQNPRSYRAYEMLYEVYLAANNTTDATATLDRATGFAALDAQEQLWRGKFLRLQDRREEAAQELRSAATDPLLWEAHLLLGALAQEQGDASVALDHYNAVLARQPNEPAALLNAGKLLMLSGKVEEADKLFARLTTLSPQNVDGHIAYSELLRGRGDLQRAVAEARRATEAGPTRADAFFHLGLAYEASRDWPRASESFKAATERDPGHFEALIRLAMSLFREDNYPESLEVSEAAIKMRPDDPQAHRWKAEAHLALRDPAAALASAVEALRHRANMPEALLVSARAYALQGDFASAEHAAREAASSEPGNARGLVVLGEVLLDGGRTQAAHEAFRAAAEIAPTSPDVITGLGRAYDADGEHEKALDFYRSASEADAYHADAHLFSGHTHAKLGRWEEAYRSYTRAVQLRPNWPEALYYLGTAHLQRKDLLSAQGSFRKATERSPNLVQAWYGLGIAARDRGQRAEAVTALRRATELNSGFAEAWLYLGLTLEESGDYAGAAEAFANAEATANEPSVKKQAQQGLARMR